MMYYNYAFAGFLTLISAGPSFAAPILDVNSTLPVPISNRILSEHAPTPTFDPVAHPDKRQNVALNDVSGPLPLTPGKGGSLKRVVYDPFAMPTSNPTLPNGQEAPPFHEIEPDATRAYIGDVHPSVGVIFPVDTQEVDLTARAVNFNEGPGIGEFIPQGLDLTSRAADGDAGPGPAVFGPGFPSPSPVRKAKRVFLDGGFVSGIPIATVSPEFTNTSEGKRAIPTPATLGLGPERLPTGVPVETPEAKRTVPTPVPFVHYSIGPERLPAGFPY